MRIFAGGEPESFRAIRDAYWAARLRVDELETRIGRTDSGLEWLMRVRRIGRRAAPPVSPRQVAPTAPRRAP